MSKKQADRIERRKNVRHSLARLMETKSLFGSPIFSNLGRSAVKRKGPFAIEVLLIGSVYSVVRIIEEDAGTEWIEKLCSSGFHSHPPLFEANETS